MKSDRRHELDTNVLAKRLSAWIESVKPYSRLIVAGVAILAIALAAWGFVSRTAASKAERAWGEFTYAVTSNPPQVEALQLAAEDYSGSKMEVWATLTWAEYKTLDAARRYFRDRETTLKNLEQAKAVFEAIADHADGDVTRNRARLGMARVLEMSNEPEKAREMYLKVTGSFSRIAQARAEALAKPSIDETFGWLATAVATLPPRPAGPGTPGDRPSFGAGFDSGAPAGAGGILGVGGDTPAAPSEQSGDALGDSTDGAPVDFSFPELDSPGDADANPLPAGENSSAAEDDSPSDSPKPNETTPAPDAPESATNEPEPVSDGSQEPESDSGADEE